MPETELGLFGSVVDKAFDHGGEVKTRSTAYFTDGIVGSAGDTGCPLGFVSVMDGTRATNRQLNGREPILLSYKHSSHIRPTTITIVTDAPSLPHTTHLSPPFGCSKDAVFQCNRFPKFDCHQQGGDITCLSTMTTTTTPTTNRLPLPTSPQTLPHHHHHPPPSIHHQHHLPPKP